VAKKRKKSKQKDVQILDPWAGLPKLLRENVRRDWQAYCAAAEQAKCVCLTDAALQRSLCRIFAVSEYVANLCQHHPEYIKDLLDSGDLLADYRPELFIGVVNDKLRRCKDETKLRLKLRSIRQREMLRIIWRDLAGWAQLEGTLQDLSALAEACVQGALIQLSKWQAKQTPVPLIKKNKPASLVVLAMGKLGAGELNLSSDIDLIFAFTDAKAARKRGALSPEEYFIQLGQSLIHVLDDRDANGFVFRVDMRLRPFGNSGALAWSFDAMEDYYQSQGREWERYAMIKARPIAGDAKAGKALMQMLKPFVYRRYLDFNTYDALRDLKRQIQAQVELKDQLDNIKLGPGGIREIEFIAQTFQLVRGGRELSLQQLGLLAVMSTIRELKLLPVKNVSRLVEAYRFLRRTENCLQAMRDEQVHCLPEDKLDRTRLAFAMGFSSWPVFARALEKQRSRVQTEFEQVFAGPDNQQMESPIHQLWHSGLADDEQSREILRLAGYRDTEEAFRLISQLREGAAQSILGEQGRIRFDQLVPKLITAVAEYDNDAELLGRLARILEKIAGRTTYLSLLLENATALKHLISLCNTSEWVASQLARHPVLLDQLLDPRSLYQPLETKALSVELQEIMRAIPEDDLEQQMDRLRQFKQAMVLRVAAADIASVIPVMVVSDYLTAIAEVVLGQALNLAWQQMVKRYGRPVCTERAKQRVVQFAVIGYGKLGGIELGYGSDLDLVFLHDSVGENQSTDSKKPIDNQVFFARLGQRIIHILDTLTPAGTLYEVDMRLRPSGNSGLLVTSVESFRDYQREDAWTWEHQALVRARIICGDEELRQRFKRIRTNILGLQRDVNQLRQDVCEMRERMRTELASKDDDVFDLKQGQGGIVDIEFMVQYHVLRWAHAHPELLRFTDTVRLLDMLAKTGHLESRAAASLAEAYRVYRSLYHHLTLRGEPALLKNGSHAEQQAEITYWWKKIMSC
jgi:glutamate-ammonia-ligase adenylyltransferase